MAKATRWGILGAGLISTDFCLALKTLNPEEHCINAVAARSLERAKKFANTFEIERSYGSYEELLRDPEIDIAYVGTIHTTHKELTILALQNGKHVLCEKPAALNLEDLEEMIAAAKKSDRLFMELLTVLAHIEKLDTSNCPLFFLNSILFGSRSVSASFHSLPSTW
eukprot:Seg1890.6 transcript_id=Seg1890.6/GoldUCD/mRNA.D3Y31 product="Trans-1 2-dihydrobenzene-1 2-diol dehydrogenase" protein_id=Seg1890.6/GoldUCD/D3Y31